MHLHSGSKVEVRPVGTEHWVPGEVCVTDDDDRFWYVGVGDALTMVRSSEIRPLPCPQSTASDRKWRTLGTGELVWLVYVIESLTPNGWMRAAESATLAWATEKITTRDGLSRAVPRYRVTRGGVVEWSE